MANIAYIFPGQGAYFAGALRHETSIFAAVEGSVGVIEAVARRRFGRSLVAAMSDETNDAAQFMISDPALLQLAIFTISVAAHDLLRSRGIAPDVLMGHSFGEIAALTCAGVYSVEQGAEIVCDRVEALADAAPRDGCMAAVSAGAAAVRTMLAEWAGDRPATLALAVENHDGQTVISGPADDVEGFITHCRARKLSAQKLHSPYGFHHPALAPVTAAFAARLARYACAVPKRPVYSPIMGRYYRHDDAFGDCLARHLVMPVAFSTALRRLRTDGVSVCIECGALDGLTRIVGRVVGADGTRAYPTFTPTSIDDGGTTTILNSIKENQAMNAPVSAAFPDFEAFWRERSPFMLALIKSEFVSFLMQQRYTQWAPVEVTTSTPSAAAAAPVAARQRDKVFAELVAVYAEAMEYPPEVFTETVELEAELGIDSVKQTEIMGRLSDAYALPTLPTNVRVSDFKTMGQVVDLVFANQGKVAVSA